MLQNLNLKYRMLRFKIVEFSFIRFVQSGLYVDFFIKKFTEIWLKNTFIFSAQYFGEKYMVEFLTKKIIDSGIYFINKNINFNNFYLNLYFIEFLTFFFYFICIVNVFLLIIH